MKKNEVLVSHFWILPTRKIGIEKKKKKTIALECKNSAFAFLQSLNTPKIRKDYGYFLI